MLNKTLFMALGTVVALSFATTASAQHCHNGNSGSFGHSNYNNNSTYVGQHQGQHQTFRSGHNHSNSTVWQPSHVQTWRPYYQPQPSRPVWHGQTHIDYHPGRFVPHQNHVDYQPGHFNRHYQGHWDH